MVSSLRSLLLGGLRPVGAAAPASSGRFCSTEAGRRGRLLVVVLVGAHHLHRALDARFRIEDRLLGLAGVGVDVGLDAGAEIVGAEIGRQRAADVVLDLRLDRRSTPSERLALVLAGSSPAASSVPLESSTVTLSTSSPGTAAATR